MVDWIPDLLISVISAAGGILAASAHWKKKEEKESSVHGLALSSVLTMDIRKFTALKDIVDSLFRTTKVDRFLIIFAFNGKDFMRFASVAYEQHKNTPAAQMSVGAVGRYIHIDIDDDYRRILKAAELTGVTDVTTSDLPTSLLRDIYEAEGVRHAKIGHVRRYVNFAGDERDLIVYCSVGTHEESPFTKAESTYIRTFMSTLRNDILGTEDDDDDR